jgi:thiol:disulfide interchange protein DsbD
MISIVLAILGAKGVGRRRGFLLSLALVMGMAVTYTILGIVAASLGKAFGAFAQHPAFLIPVSAIFALFALSLFGAFEMRLPSGLQARLQSGSRQGFLGAFLMGLVLGPISAPCVGPVVGTVLLGIATQGQVLLGALQLFTFALGMGVLFLAVGTFSASLPRSGEWLVTLKQFLGLVALGFAAWNIRLLGPAWLQPALWTLILLLGGGVLGAFRPAEGLLPAFRKGLGLACLALGLLLGVRAVETGLDLSLLPRGGAPQEPRAETWRQTWLENDFEGALARAKAQDKLVVVDIWAEWCAACKELDEKTWPDPRVAEWLERNAVVVRVDTDRVRKDLEKSLRILGYPTVLVLDGDGKELRRQVGFQNPEAMLAFLAQP